MHCALNAAVVDLGFNSVKMVCYLVNNSGRFRPYRQDAFKARLGEGLDETGYLGEAQIRRTIGYLKALSEIALIESVDNIIPVATSAVREASNGNEFLRQVLKETRLSFRVLSERDEALYSFAGAIGFAPEPNVVFFDLGGGSLEIVCSSGFRISKTLSLPLGSLRVALEFGHSEGSFSKQSVKQMKKHVRNLLSGGLDAQMPSRATLVGVGGTVRALARYDQKLSSYPFDKTQSYHIHYKSINKMSRSLLKMSHKELSDENAVGNRSDSIAAGSLVVKMLMKHLGSQELKVSSYGLREGTLWMYLRNQKSFHSGLEAQAEVERFVRDSVRLNLRILDENPLSLEKARLLNRKEAALLAEAYSLASYAQPSVNLKSYFFSLLEEDSSLSHREQLIAAIIVIASRNKRVAESLMNEFGEFIPEGGRNDVERLAAVYAFLETAERVGVRIQASRRARDLEIVAPPGKRSLPKSLLELQAETMAETLGLGVSLSFTSWPKETINGGRLSR